MVRDISLSPGQLPELPVGTEPDILYHYTDAGGLLGIVTSKCLWASEVWYMNDTREALYGLDTIKRALKSMTPASGEESDVHEEALKRLANLPNQDDIVQSYIACLSKEGDQLSQWRAYGRPRGFSVGFDRRRLQSICSISAEMNKPSYRAVTYDVHVQDNMISMIFHTTVQRFAAVAGDNPAGAAWLFILEALLLTPAFKDPAFMEEQEVRLQLFHDPKTGIWNSVKFRIGAMGITPYVNISLTGTAMDCLTLIREVIVGPQSNQEEAMRSVKQLLAHNGLQDVEVRPSKVPLRL